MKSNAYSIEFTGIGGVGKTTIIEAVCHILDKSNIPYDNLTKIKTRKINLHHIFPILKATFLTLLVKPKSFKGFIKILKGQTIHQFINKSINEEKKIRVFDEGFIHKTRALIINTKNTKMINLINRLSKYNKLPDMLIIIEANPKLIMERKIKRNREKDKFDYESIVKETMDKDFEKTIELLVSGRNKYEKTIEVVRLDNFNEKDILINANKIVKIIENKHKELIKEL